MDVPARTAYTLKYKADNQAEIWQGVVHLLSTRRIVATNIVGCLLIAFALAQRGSIPTLLVSFFGIFATCAFIVFLNCVCTAFLHTLTVAILTRLYAECKTEIDEFGIRDTLGPLKFNYKWQQVHDVEIKNGSVYVIALFNGIHIPASAFEGIGEAEDFFALARQYQTSAHRGKNQIAKEATPVEDTDRVLQSLEAEEEAKWREIEDKHRESRQ